MSTPTRAPINWPASLMLSLTAVPVFFVLPVYLWFAEVSTAAWVWAGLFWMANGMSITAGYHRLWAHRAYQAHPVLKWFFAVFGGMAVQNSILIWATGHRIHHRHVDDVDHDPYSAKRGFWFSHIGWMLRNYPSGEVDFDRAPDLLKDKVVMFQHRHYLWFAFGSNFGIVMALGALYGDMWGFVLVAGFLRLFVSHHATFFINSLAHMWGRQPYTTTNTAKDNDVLALFTWGEGYHNYHHYFQWDYRNGIRWWQWDPTKWAIATASGLGLASDLKRVPEVKIQQARVTRELERTREALEARAEHNRFDELKAEFDAEWREFKQTVSAWAQIQSARIDAAKAEVKERWERSEIKEQIDAIDIERSLRDQLQRLQALQRQFATA